MIKWYAIRRLTSLVICCFFEQKFQLSSRSARATREAYSYNIQLQGDLITEAGDIDRIDISRVVRKSSSSRFK